MCESPQVFIAPGKYVQGPGAIGKLGEHLLPLGERVLVTGGRSGLTATRAGREEGFLKHRLWQREEVFGGECSDAEIERLTQYAKASGCDVIAASGGGKVIDAAKATAENLGVPVVVIPTIASTDSPCSALSVIYHDDGSFKRHWLLKRNPQLVLVDTQIIAQSPPQQLVNGMGDALATWFEADACYRANAKNVAGGKITQTAVTLAKLCYDILITYGRDAKAACEKQTVTPALEKVVEANTLLSGLGFESGGVAVAHALSEGFSVVEEMHHFSHGQKVAFGLLVQLILEGRDKQIINDVYDFCSQVGLPVTLSDLHCEHTDQKKLRQAAEIAAEPGRPTGNMGFPVTGHMLYEAILEADAYGKNYQATNGFLQNT